MNIRHEGLPIELKAVKQKLTSTNFGSLMFQQKESSVTFLSMVLKRIQDQVRSNKLNLQQQVLRAKT
jgi:hypothetical protein